MTLGRMSEATPSAKHQVFTIGHSNQSLEGFVALVKRYHIELLVDVRSQPYSKYASQFDAESIKAALTSQRIRYLFLGRELGGRPADLKHYDAKGYVLYGQIARSPAFLSGIAHLEKGASRYRIALMCSEENPMECHRHLLIGRVLAEKGITVSHIRGDGSLQGEAELARDEQPRLPLFEEPEETVWRSVRPVLRREGEPASAED